MSPQDQHDLASELQQVRLEGETEGSGCLFTVTFATRRVAKAQGHSFHAQGQGGPVYCQLQMLASSCQEDCCARALSLAISRFGKVHTLYIFVCK